MQISTLKLTIIVFFPYASKMLFGLCGYNVQQKLEGQKRWDVSLVIRQAVPPTSLASNVGSAAGSPERNNDH